MRTGAPDEGTPGGSSVSRTSAAKRAATVRRDRLPPLRGQGSSDFTDRTTRARILKAAMEHFAQEGYERSTIRAIAQTAGVSHGMLRHHYGSKVALRAACDDYVLETLQGINAQITGGSTEAMSSRQSFRQFGGYVARSLVDGSPTAGPIFDLMVSMTEQWLARAGDIRPHQPVETRVRAAVVTAVATTIPLLHDQLSSALGIDVSSPEGFTLIVAALLDIHPRDAIEEPAPRRAATP